MLLSVVLALEYGLLALGPAAGRPGCRLAAVWSAGVWVLEETLRGRFPLGGFTWGRWAFSQSGSPLVHLAAWGGAALVSFAVALCRVAARRCGPRLHRRTGAAARPTRRRPLAVAAVSAHCGPGHRGRAAGDRPADRAARPPHGPAAR